MQMDAANDEVAQRPDGRIKLLGMERWAAEVGGCGLGKGREGGDQEAPPPRWLDCGELSAAVSHSP